MTIKREMITVLTREEMFAKNCKIFDLRREYPRYEGDISWVIATSYSNDELCVLYSDLIKPYEPFMLLSAEEGQAYRDFIINEDKYQKRRIRSVDIFGYDDDLSSQFHKELCVYDEMSFEQEERIVEEKHKDWQITMVRKGIDQLTETQKRRVNAVFFENKTLREVADEEGVNFSKIDKSVKQALKKLKKFLETGGTKADLCPNE